MKYTFFLLALFFSSVLFAQKSDIKFGKVSEEELAMTVYSPDTLAGAVVLVDKGNLSFLLRAANTNCRFERHTRIKILNRTGLNQGDIFIPFYSYKKYESIKGIKVIVFAPDGSQVEMSKKDYFEEEVNDYFSRMRIAVPNLQVGSIIDLTYDTDSKSMFQLPTWYFQREIPIVYSELLVDIPEWLNYNIQLQGAIPNKKQLPHTDEGLSLQFLESTLGRIDIDVDRKQWIMQDVPALTPEAHVTTMEDYYPKVRFQLSSIKIPGQPITNVTNSWGALTSQLYEASDFGEQYTKTKNHDRFIEATKDLIPKNATPVEKVIILQKFLFEALKRESTERIFVSGKLNDKMDTKSASGTELNLIMLALLKAYQVDANPMLVSTRNNGKPVLDYPLLEQFNHVLLLVHDGERYIMVDIGNPNRAPGYPSINVLNGKGLVLIGNTSQWVDLPTPNGSKTYLLNLNLDENGQVSGDIAMNLEGYAAVEYRGGMADTEVDKFLQKHLSETFPDISFENVTTEQLEDITKPLKIRAKCTIPNAATVSGNFIYLTSGMFGDHRTSPFTKEKRHCDIDFSYPYKEQIILNLKFPEGYNLEDTPQPAKISLPENRGSFQYNLTTNATNGMQLISKLQINNQHFEVEAYDGLRYFFETVAGKFQESLVLKKI